VTGVEAAYAALGARDWDVYREAMTRQCPWCRAKARQPCTTLGLPLMKGERIHPSRRKQ
jgi:hypothetical protein